MTSLALRTASTPRPPEPTIVTLDAEWEWEVRPGACTSGGTTGILRTESTGIDRFALYPTGGGPSLDCEGDADTFECDDLVFGDIGFLGLTGIFQEQGTEMTFEVTITNFEVSCDLTWDAFRLEGR